MISSERIAAGTKLVVLSGGPPEWDGHETAIAKVEGRNTLERWDHTADAAVIYVQTDDVVQVEVEHVRRTGTVIETKDAEAYRFLGYKEELQ